MPSLRALRHSISVSTSILTTWVVSYACTWTHLYFIYCIVFFYSRLYGWLLCFLVYVFVLDDMDLLWLFMLDFMDLFWLIIMEYMDFHMLMDIFFTNVLVLRLWWLIGGAFILFDDEGGELFNMCYENMHVSRGSMHVCRGSLVKQFSNQYFFNLHWLRGSFS